MIMPSLQSVLLVVLLAAVLHLFLAALVRRSCTCAFSFRLGRFALRDLSYRRSSSSSSVNGQAPLSIFIKRVGLAVIFRPRSSGSSKERRWLSVVVRISGANVFLPRQLMLAKPSQSAKDSSSSGGAIGPLSRAAKDEEGGGYIRTTVLPWLSASLAHAVVALLAFVTFEGEVDMELDQVAVVRAAVRLGGGMRSSYDEDDQLRAWIGIDRFAVHQWLDDKFTTATVLPAAAVEISSPVWIALEAPLKSSIGLSGLIETRGQCIGLMARCMSADVDFGTTSTDGVRIRTQQLSNILSSLSDVLAQSTSLHSSSSSSPAPHPTSLLQSDVGRQHSPLQLLKSFSLSLPLLVISTEYATALLPNDTRHRPTSFTFGMRIEGFEVDAQIGGHVESIAKSDHKEWFGRQRQIGFETKAAWKRIIGNIQLDKMQSKKGVEIETNLISLNESTLNITSTWLPEAMVYVPDASLSASNRPCDGNENLVVLSLEVGQLKGRTNFSTLDHALRIYQSRPKLARPIRHPSTALSSSSSPAFLVGLPIFAANVCCTTIDLRTHGPLTPSAPYPADHGSARYTAQSQARTRWTSLDSLCLTSSSVSAVFSSEYSDRSVQRTDMERRILKKEREEEAMIKVGRSSDALEESVKLSLEEREIEIPPPPIFVRPPHSSKRSRTIHPIDLNQYSLKYSAQLTLSTDILDLFILSHKECLVDHTSSTTEERFEVVSLGPISSALSCSLVGANEGEALHPSLDPSTARVEMNILVEDIAIELWQPVVLFCLGDFISSFSTAAASSTVRPSSASATHLRPLVDILPVDFGIYFSIAAITIRLAAMDAKAKSTAIRGVALQSGPIVFEYLQQRSLRPSIVNYPHRQLLELREDIRVEANSVVSERPDVRQALFKLTLNRFHVDPIRNARESVNAVNEVVPPRRRRSSITGAIIEDDWELRNRGQISDLAKRNNSILHSKVSKAAEGILDILEVTFRLRLLVDTSPSHALDAVTLSVEAEQLTLHLDIFHSYLCLLATSTILSLLPSSRSPRTSPSTIPVEHRRPPPIISLRLELIETHIFLTLPHSVQLFAQLRRTRMLNSSANGTSLEWDTVMVAGTSPTVAGKWDDLLRLRSATLRLQSQEVKDRTQPYIVHLTAESARLRIPFRYAVSTVIDNAIEFSKAIKQLVHQLVQGNDGFILNPVAESAKLLPRIDIDVRMFAIEIQDDPFETRLNIIWRVGYEEQMARVERYDAFDAKVESIVRTEKDGLSERVGTSGRNDEKRATKEDYSVGIEDARQKLRSYDATHWAKRMRNAVGEQGRREEALTRRLYGVRHHTQPRAVLPIDLLPISRSSPLARATFQDLRLAITGPAFENLPDFLFDVGKGLPRETTFSLLVPFHLSWKMEEARFQLRDYPLPLLHIPPMSGSGHDYAAWECEMDLVIAEEMGDEDSIRRASCTIVPSSSSSTGLEEAYTIVIPRSAMTVKSYANPTIIIRSPFATRIGWGNSIQPAVQDVVKVLDSLSKSSPDPSERMGFWDKLRLQFHWQIRVSFKGEGPLHFHLKGTRDPYALTGFGAGFSKAWKGNVEFLIGHGNEAKEFFQIESQEYIMGIPNLREYVDNAATGMARDPGDNDDRSMQYSVGTDGGGGNYGRGRLNQDADFIKVCAKFINGVRWGMGAILERSCRSECVHELCRDKMPFHRQCRIFHFIPHWEVRTKTADATPGPEGILSDSFAGFRSDFIHFSISLISPLTIHTPTDDDPESDDNLPPSPRGYNSLHFSPQASTHFWAWWKLFDGSMSLPIRQGKLFPSAQPSSKKFGKHCATIKYRFSLSPLFISHAYRQESWSDWSRGETTLVALKGKVGRFNVDIHQREQQETVLRPNSKDTKVVMRKVFYQAEVDCEEVDLRVMSACFSEPEKHAVVPDSDEYDQREEASSKRDFSIADEDLDWIDLDDFVDAVYTIPDENPRVQILPFIKCPRFTYYRQIDLAPKGEGVAMKSMGAKSKFGTENSHSCLMGCATDTLTVQIDAAKQRLLELELALSQPRSNSKDGPKEEIHHRILAIRRIIARLVQLRRQNAAEDVPAQSESLTPHSESYQQPQSPSSSRESFDQEDQSNDLHLPHMTSTLYQEWGEWENRYMIHNPTIHISNSTREVLLKYYYASRDRRGFVYYLSASAIKFIRDLAKEHQSKDNSDSSRSKSKSTRTKGERRTKEVFEEVRNTNRLLDELINGIGSATTNKDAAAGGGGTSDTPRRSSNGRRSFGDALDVDPDSAADQLPDSYDLQSGHLCVFIKPQIALQSDLDDKSVVILTAFRAQVKVFSVVDLNVLDDPLNSQVLHQTFATLDGLQAFYPRHQLRRNGAVFVPLETLVDLRVEPWGFDRIVPRTSASLRYDKFNQLRMSAKGSAKDVIREMGSGESHFATGTDRISVEIDKFSVSANPDHFAAIYNVVSDLLLYSDPLQKSRSNELEAVVFTHDFSDLHGVSNIVASLQQRIRALAGVMQQYQVHLDELDHEGRMELFVTRAEFALLSYEVTVVMMAITRAQDVNGGRTSKTAGVHFEARASELVWHMLDHTDTPFAKFSVNGVEFSWISKQDTSTSNRLVIRDLKALNSSPDQVFAEIVSKLEGVTDHELANVGVFAAVLWNALAPVGGISIVEQFEVHLHPIRLQLEHGIGRMITDYIFSQRHRKSSSALRDGKDNGGEKKRGSQLLTPFNPNSSFNRSTDSLGLTKRPASTRSSNRSIYGDDDSPIPSSSSFVSLNTASASASMIGSEVSRFRRAASSESISSQGQEVGLDADEMRMRAALNKTFVLIDITATVLCLTYRSEKADHSRLPDIYNITYKTPSLQYRSKTWSYLNLLEALKRDVIKSAWAQGPQLLAQLLKTAHRKLPLQDVRRAAKRSLTSRLSPVFSISSPLASRNAKPSTPSLLDRVLTPVSSRGDDTERPRGMDNDDVDSESDGDDAASTPADNGQRLVSRNTQSSLISSHGIIVHPPTPPRK